MRQLIIAAICVLNALILGAAGSASIFSFSFDLLLASMVSMAVIEKSNIVLLLALLGGLLIDILFAPAIGFYTISYVMLAGVLIFAVKQITYIDNYLVPMLICFCSYLLKDIIVFICTLILGLDVSFGVVFVKSILISLLLTTAIMPFVHIIIRKLYYFNSLQSTSFKEYRTMRRTRKK